MYIENVEGQSMEMLILILKSCYNFINKQQKTLQGKWN